MPARQAIRVVFLLFISATCLDLYHNQPIWAGREETNGQNLPKAYEILKTQYAPVGPGYLLSDLTNMTWNHSMDFAAYSFNAIVNPRIQPTQIRWVALLENEEYLPFLNRRISGIQWHDLGPDNLWKKGRRFLGVIPIRSDNKEILGSWCKIDIEFRNDVADFLNHLPAEPVQQFIQKLLDTALGERPDPFLESCRDEKILFLLSSNDPAISHATARLALEKGYPLPIFKEVETHFEHRRE